MLNTTTIKKDFPIFRNQQDFVYLDSAAMSLKPRSVIDAVEAYYEQYSANVFRGIYKISEKATKIYEQTREKVAVFINAKSEKEVIFLRNSTEAINLVAYTWGRTHIDKKSEIVTTILEHHSNFVPWQQLIIENGAVLKIINIDESGKLILDQVGQIITKKTKLLAITYVSNAIGTINPLREIIKEVKRKNSDIIVLVDGAQAVPHIKVDVQDLGCDFFVFSGQKMLGPTGAGVLWGREELLEEMSPFLFGGEMIKEVYLDRTVFADLPHKFEAGTPHIAGVIGLGAAIDYLTQIGMDQIRLHEKKLYSYAQEKLRKLDTVVLYGPNSQEERSGVILFTMKSAVHPHDVAQILDELNICVRSGHHCTMPLHERLDLSSTIRASLYLYNTMDDIDKLVKGLQRVDEVL